jgi:acyl dehydratase
MDPLYFEDMEVGASWRSGERTISEDDVLAFAQLSGDRNPLQVDAGFAATTPFGERVVHGALVLAIATGLRQQQGTFIGTLRAWLGLRDGRFVAPVLFGDSVHVLTEIAATRATRDPAVGLVTQTVTILNQRDEVVQTGEFAQLVVRRPARA